MNATDCFLFQTMACAQCLKTHHVGLDHRTEHVNDAETRCREELAHFSQEMNARQINCRLNANRYEKMLGELQQQHDAARASVEQVHRQYLDLLEKKREQALEELATLHAKQVIEDVHLTFQFTELSMLQTNRNSDVPQSGRIYEGVSTLTSN